MSVRNTIMRGFVALLALAAGGQALAARSTTYLFNDGLGSVVAATSEAGTVLWRKDYAPFGAQIDSTPEKERTSYTGKQHDDDIGLTYFGARYYDPEVARFVSIDPLAFVDDNTMSFNRYMYVNNNPYKYVDPDGKWLNFVAKFVLDVAVNVAINYATSGSLGIGMALKDSAMGIMNPAKTIAKIKKLANIIAKVEKKLPIPPIKLPCAGKCFVAGTTVLTERGYVPIETLKAGDKVWAHDPDTGVTTLKPILHTFVNRKDSVWKLVLEKDGFRYLHEVTGTHPYYVLEAGGTGQWTEVAHLAAGAIVETEDGMNALVVSVNDTHEVVTTYNIQVADINTYYVSAAKVLVHNCPASVKASNLPVAKPGTKGWDEAVDSLSNAGKGKVNVRTASATDAKKLLEESRGKMDRRKAYTQDPYKKGYESHNSQNARELAADNDLQHLKWKDGKSGGHIFYDKPN